MAFNACHCEEPSRTFHFVICMPIRHQFVVWFSQLSLKDLWDVCFLLLAAPLGISLSIG